MRSQAELRSQAPAPRRPDETDQGCASGAPTDRQSGGVDRKIQPFAAQPVGIRCEHNPGATILTGRYNEPRRARTTTSMNFSQAAAAASTAQARPSVARLRRSLSLRTRLALLVTLAVGLTISVQAIIEIGIFERTVRRDLLENARLSATAVA